MAFSIVHGDIVTMDTDAIVNAANAQLFAGSGVCGAIFRAVGARAKELQDDCLAKAPCPTGQSVLTDSYGLKAKYIIHTVGPIWQGGRHREEELLYSCYRTALDLAAKAKCQSIAFPPHFSRDFRLSQGGGPGRCPSGRDRLFKGRGFGRSLSPLSLTGGRMPFSYGGGDGIRLSENAVFGLCLWSLCYKMKLIVTL